MKFSKGDVVIVKSGGPALTVVDVDDDEVKCLYFAEELGEFKKTTLPAFVLESYEEDEEDEDEEEEEDEEDEDDEEEDEPMEGESEEDEEDEEQPAS